MDLKPRDKGWLFGSKVAYFFQDNSERLGKKGRYDRLGNLMVVLVFFSLPSELPERSGYRRTDQQRTVTVQGNPTV